MLAQQRREQAIDLAQVILCHPAHFRIGRRQFRGDVDEEAALRRPHAAAGDRQHRRQRLPGRGLGRRGIPHAPDEFAGVEREGRPQHLLLGAERRIEAGARNAHDRQEIVERRGRITLFPEQVGGMPERDMLVEASRSTHAFVCHESP
nr:hypothetical protein [Pseudomonas sp.]